MKGFQRLALLGALALMSSQAPAAVINLAEYAFNIDGTVTNGSAPGGVNVGSFDTSTGLGMIRVTLSGAGSRYVGLFLDHEIDEAFNTYFNEVGSTSGAAAAGQSWEIDEPGYVFGDIYDNFSASALDNGIGTPNPEDVSMALAWDFDLAAGETAYIDFFVSTTAPGSGFYLVQTDPDSQASIYMWSTKRIGGGGQPNPEPATLALLGLGLAGLWQMRRKTAM